MDELRNAIEQWGQLSLVAAILLVIFAGIVAYILTLRQQSKVEANEARRADDTARLLATVADMAKRAEDNREKALDSRNSETAQAITQQGIAYAAALGEIKTAIEANTRRYTDVIEYREKMTKAFTASTDAIAHQTVIMEGLGRSFGSYQSLMDSAVESLIKSVDALTAKFEAAMSDNPTEHARVEALAQDIKATVLRIEALLTPPSPPRIAPPPSEKLAPKPEDDAPEESENAA